MFKNTISQDLQDAIKKVMDASSPVAEALVGNQHKIDKNKNGRIDAQDFKLLKGQKAAPVKEATIIEQDEDNTTAEVAGHKVTLHRSLSKPGMSDTYTLHHPSGNKKVTISYDTHGDGEEVHGDKVNRAFGLDSKHKLGHKIAGSMSGMGGISKFEESVEQTDEAHTMSHQAKTTMKHIPNASPALKKAAKDIKPGIAGYRDRVAMLKAGGVKNEEHSDEAEDKKLIKKMMKKTERVKEEVEELDELKKSTLASYAKSAGISSTINRKIAADFEKNSEKSRSPGMKNANIAMSQKYKEKSWKRRDGAAKAIDRLAKEEVELDEAKSLHKMSADELNQAHKDNEAKIDSIHKNDPSKRITMNHPLISKRRSINLHKVIRSKQSNPNYIPPPAHGYNEEADQEVAEGWDDMLKANKERAAAADKAKGTGKFDKKVLSPGTTQYTRKSKTFTDGGSDADLRKANRKSNEEVDETTVIHNSFTVNLKEAYTFGEYLQAAKSIVGEDEAVMLANKAFGAQDVGIFEQAITIQNMIKEMNNLEKAGHSISEPKYNIELGNPYYEYTVTEDTGARRKYIHHGDVVTN